MNENIKNSSGKSKGPVNVAGVLVVAVIAAIGIFLFIKSRSSDSYRSISVVDTVGTVDLARDGYDDILEPYKGMHLISGDNLDVKSKSELDMLLDENKFVCCEENTQMSLEATGTDANSRTVIHLSEGGCLSEIKNKLNENSTYSVETPNSTMAVRGTTFRVYVYLGEDGNYYTIMQLFEGALTLVLHDQEGRTVRSGITLAEGYQMIVVGDSSGARIVKQEYKGEMLDMIPIDYHTLPLSAIEHLAEFLKEEDADQIYEADNSMNYDDFIRMLTPTPVPTPAVTPTLEPTPTPEATITPVPTYVVTFTCDGEVFAIQNVAGVSPVTEPILMPGESGGWYTVNGEAYDFSADVEGDLELIWKNMGE